MPCAHICFIVISSSGIWLFCVRNSPEFVLIQHCIISVNRPQPSSLVNEKLLSIYRHDFRWSLPHVTALSVSLSVVNPVTFHNPVTTWIDPAFESSSQRSGRLSFDKLFSCEVHGIDILSKYLTFAEFFKSWRAIPGHAWHPRIVANVQLKRRISFTILETVFGMQSP